MEAVGADGFVHDGAGIVWCDLLQTLLAFDEIAAGLAAFVVTLDHRQFFSHVQGDVVVLRATVAASTFGRSILSNQKVVVALGESVLSDTSSNPVFEMGVNLKEPMQFASIDQLRWLAVNGSGENGDKLGGLHDASSW